MPGNEEDDNEPVSAANAMLSFRLSVITYNIIMKCTP